MFHSKNQITTVAVTAKDTAIETNSVENLVHIIPPDQLEIELFDITAKINEQGLDNYASLVYNAEDESELKSLSDMQIDLHDNSWILVEDRFYLVNMYLFDRSKHKIELTENLLFSFALDQEFLEIYNTGRITLTKAQNSNMYIVKATKIVHNTPATGKLADVETQDDEVYNFDYERLIVERGIQITSQIELIHPTDEIRLPYLGYFKPTNKGITKQLWHLPATGGTGSYKWETNDENIAFAKPSLTGRDIGEVRGYNLGKTTIRVVDAQNPFNYASIVVYVTKIKNLVWLESKIEKENGGQADYSSLIAYDDSGKKYTNCSSLIYDLGAQDSENNIVSLRTSHMGWNQTQRYIQDNLNLVKLRHRFDDNLDVIYGSDLPSSGEFNEVLELHNNFGICGTDEFITGTEGLARVKATLPINYDTAEYGSKLESETLMIASYTAPTTISPSYEKIFDDLSYPKQPHSQTKLFEKYFQNDIFKISYGSSLYWVFNGGTNYWADDIYTLAPQISNDGYGLTTKSLSDNLPPLANRVTYKFTCDNTGLSDLKKYDISILLQNKQTRSLLRPQKNVAQVHIHCAIPKSVELKWAQKEKALAGEYVNMPDYVMENNEVTYYLRNSQSRHMRALVFDQHKQLILNTTSLNIDFYTEETEKLSFTDFGRNDKQIAVFSDQKDIVYARVKIESDVNGNSIYDVNNYKRIKLIEKVKISPSFQTRYLHEDNVAEFYILDGSNTFRVKANSSEIATLNHLTDINTIEMSPEEEGLVEIVVEDLGVEKVEYATATLLVSDVAKIELIGGGLIEQGNSMNLTIVAYDSQGKAFDKDQLKYIDIKAEIEKVGTAKREGLEVKRINEDTFTAYGVSAGNYRTTVVTCKRRNANDRISSNFVRIQVFEVVRIVPDSILLFPGARWTIQVEGGPHGGSRGSVYREYEIEDDKIADIDEYGEVHAKRVGETWLMLNMYYKSNNSRALLASRKIRLRVALITGLEIPMMNERSVFANSVTRLNVKLKHDKETFLHAIGPLSFEWVTSTSHVYSLSLPSKKDSVGGGGSLSLQVSKNNVWNGQSGQFEDFKTNFNYSSVVGVAHKNGDARIGVKMAIEYPEEYRNEQNFFTHNIRVKVTDKLTMNVPEFIEYPEQQPHVYVLPPLAQNKIVTNKDAKVKLAYSIQTGIHYDRGLG